LKLYPFFYRILGEGMKLKSPRRSQLAATEKCRLYNHETKDPFPSPGKGHIQKLKSSWRYYDWM
jgi:hypothetical protein